MSRSFIASLPIIGAGAVLALVSGAAPPNSLAMSNDQRAQIWQQVDRAESRAPQPVAQTYSPSEKEALMLLADRLLFIRSIAARLMHSQKTQ